MKLRVAGRVGVSMIGVLVVSVGVGVRGPMSEALAADTLTASPAPAPVRTSPRLAAGGPDAEAYGASLGYPVAAIHRQPFLVGLFSHYDRMWQGRMIGRAGQPSVLVRSDAEPLIGYRHDGQTRSLDEYLAHHPVTGLLVARDDTLLVERYQYGRSDAHRLASFSMAKTVVAMLVGIAIEEGAIRSVDDAAAVYVPALEGTEYGRTSLRHLLQMSSGVRFDEGSVDFERLWVATVAQGSAGGVRTVQPYDQRHRWAGAQFSYASADTQVLGLALASAVRQPLAQYLQDRLWQPMGAEADASWIIDAAGQEVAYCCLNAVLRDYARLALLLAHGGRSGGRQLIPAAWLNAATRVATDDPHLQLVWPERGFGYGYQTWVFNDRRPMFALIGAHGQAIFVDPTSRLVMVHTAVRLQRAGIDAETLALWRGVVAALGRTLP
jgi:CubicO group peptidase (beta-lactamase class C family)